MKQFLCFILVIIAFCVCLQASSYALTWEEIKTDLKDNIEKNSVLGLGVFFPESPYKGVDEDVYVIPIAVLEYKRFFIDGTALGFNLVDDDDLKFSVIGVSRLEGYDPDDSSDLAGMSERDYGFDMGLRLLLENDTVTFSVSGLADPWDVHSGQELNSFVSVKLFEGFLRPKVGVRWLSEDLVDYYYGVRASEVTVARSEYEPGSTVNYIAGLTIGIPLKGQWALIGDIQYEWLGDEINDSPIVDEDGIFRYVAGVVYRF